MFLRPGRRPMFPPVQAIQPGPDGLVAVGGDLEPETLVEAYRKGLFPWDGHFPYPWYSPDPRCILRPEAFVAHHALRKLDRQGRYDVALDRDFRAVMHACAATPRPGQSGTWISPGMIDAYEVLHRRGVAHAVGVYRPDGTLVGGLYGLSLGRAFFGESMFSHERDVSKLALWRLCRALHAASFAFVDAQQDTPHLRSLGATSVPRATYLALLAGAVEAPDAWPLVVRAWASPAR